MLSPFPMASSSVKAASTIFKTLREMCHSVTKRYDNIRDNSEQLGILRVEIYTVLEKVGVLEKKLNNCSEKIVTESLELELIELKRIMQRIGFAEKKVDELENKMSRKRHKVSRANKNAKDISQLLRDVRDIGSLLINMHEKLKEITKEEDFFTPKFPPTPRLWSSWHLDFFTTDTVEGEMKVKVVDSTSHSAQETKVNAKSTAVVGVAGMGGVGKTTALLGLAQDPDIRKNFSNGGIHILTVGKDVAESKLVVGLKEMVHRSGGEKYCEKIDSNGSLKQAVSRTSSWFSGRKALFILDDLWQTSSNRLGYLDVLMGLLNECPASHVLFSTRSNTIASETQTRIEFKPRKKLGSEARGIFLASAGLSETVIHENDCEGLVIQVLRLCEGVPLMLSIAGAQVRGRKGTPVAALKRLLHSVDVERLILPKERQGEYPYYFYQTVEGSLKIIADVLECSGKFKEAWNEQSAKNLSSSEVTIVDFVFDCFQRLCILPRSARVSEQVIIIILRSIDQKLAWSVIDSLVNYHLLFELESVDGESTFGLHDVILDFCEKASKSGPNGKYCLYHKEFLIHAGKVCLREPSAISDAVTVETSEDCDVAPDVFPVVEACEGGRPWWKISSSEELSGIQNYLLENIFRHLRECGKIAEAVGLLTHVGWTKLRISRGGIVALNADFSLVADAIRPQNHRRQDHEAWDDAFQGLTKIWETVKRAWPVILKNADALPTHAYGYLLGKENKLPLVERYLQSMADIAIGAWFKPKAEFWHILDSSSNSQIFRCCERVWFVAVYEDSQMIIAATKSTLFWIDAKTMKAVREREIRDENVSESQIRSFCFCERRGIIALGFSTGELELWDEKRGDLLRAIPNAHEDVVWGVDISRDGQRVVSGSNDRTVRLWDTQTGWQIGNPLCGHEGIVWSVAFSKDGRRVVSGSGDYTVRLWDTHTGTQIGDPLRGHEGIVWSVAFSKDGQRVASGSDDCTVRLWDTQTRSQIGNPLCGHEGIVWIVAFSEDGRRVVSGSGDKTVRLWDTHTGTQIGDPLRGHENGPWSVAFSKDGQRVVSGSRDNTVRLWDTQTGTHISDPLRGHTNTVRSVALSTDGQRVVSGSRDKTLRMWDTPTGKQIGDPLRGHTNTVYCVAFSTDGQRVVSGSRDKTLRMWDTPTGKQIGNPLRGHERKVCTVAFSEDGRRIVSGSEDKTIRLWDTHNGTQIGDALRGHENCVMTVAFSGDGRRIVSGSEDKTIRLWDTHNGTQIGDALRGHENCVMTVAFSGDGRRIVSGSEDKTIRLWDTYNGTQIGDALRGHENCVMTVAFSGDGRVVMSRSRGGTVILWTQEASGSHWNRYCVCSLPVSTGFNAAFVERHEPSEGTITLVCPLLGGMMFFDLMEP